MNTQRHDTNTANRNRRWRTTALAGATVALTAVAALVAPVGAHAGPDRRDFVPRVQQDPPQGHPCFLVRATWNEALDGPQPECGTTIPLVGEPQQVAPGFGAADCPPPPDPRYVAVPSVPPTPTGCDTLDRWWLHVALGV